MTIDLPELSLIVLIGPSGSGKSTFARKHFKPTEVISSDACRALVADDENDLSATPRAFEVLHFIAGRRLANGKLTVVDATNVRPEDRKPLIALAKEYHCLPVAIVFDLPERVCQDRNLQRKDRKLGPHVVRQQLQEMKRSQKRLDREGFRHVFVLRSPEDVETVQVERRPLWTNLRDEHGPFDIIGDIHGCLDELLDLLEKLGYQVEGNVDEPGPAGLNARHPQDRKIIFLGDLVDRGPDVVGVLRLAMNMVASGRGLCLPGNHEQRLLRQLRGDEVKLTHGLKETLAQIEVEPPEFREKVRGFLDGLISHYVLDGGRLVVAHAGMKEELQGRASKVVRDFALFGETTGETDEFGLPIRYDWAEEYRGRALVVYGHTPVPEPEWTNRTINIDTGCVFGGKLTALRYPEKELVSAPAKKRYYEPIKPFPVSTSEPLVPGRGSGDDLLDVKDVLGKRIVKTRLRHNVVIRGENSAAALEVMSRFAADPRWVIYLPPTMSPPETSGLPGFLEHPQEVFAYYRRQGVSKVVCEEKHMGSRAVVIVCRDKEAARKRFRIDNGTGICYTRTGRPFFENPSLQEEVLRQLSTAIAVAGLWDSMSTDWICLDCELMPWSVKAQALLREQYAPVGAAAQVAMDEAFQSIDQAAGRGLDVGTIRSRYDLRRETIKRYVDAYRRYCWPVRSLTDLKLAPFHVMATEGAVHANKDHLWHLETIAKIRGSGQGLIAPTSYRVVDFNESGSEERGFQWWEELTTSGSEGMVVKPMEFVARGQKGLVQPAIKCRGREYLRIIYGPEYTSPENLERLRPRGVTLKRSLAIREFALGIEALERFVAREPLYRVHECVFGVLALESEPVDPRL